MPRFELPSTDTNRPSRFDESSATSTHSKWFAVYTTCRHEKRVALHFEQREIEHFLPLYIARRKWRDGSKVLLQLPLFPCYIFVRIPRLDRGRVLSVPGTQAVVGGTGGEPAQLADSAIDSLRQGVQLGGVEPHTLLTVGEAVRIRSGAFAGMTGIVSRKKSGFRVVLTLQQIMQSVAVEIDEDDVEAMEDRSGAGSLSVPGASLNWQHA